MTDEYVAAVRQTFRVLNLEAGTDPRSLPRAALERLADVEISASERLCILDAISYIIIGDRAKVGNASTLIAYAKMWRDCVERLPMTVDGVRLIPEDGHPPTVYAPDGTPCTLTYAEVNDKTLWRAWPKDPLAKPENMWSLLPHDCYSTPQAAEAARKES